MIFLDLENAHVIKRPRRMGILVRRSRLDHPKPDIHTLDTYMHRDGPSQDIAIIYSLLKLHAVFSTPSKEGQMGQLGGTDRIEVSRITSAL